MDGYETTLEHLNSESSTNFVQAKTDVRETVSNLSVDRMKERQAIIERIRTNRRSGDMEIKDLLDLIDRDRD